MSPRNKYLHKATVPMNPISAMSIAASNTKCTAAIQVNEHHLVHHIVLHDIGCNTCEIA